MPGIVPALQLGVKLGKGYFGEVFEAIDSVHGQVAVKVLSRQPGQDDAEWQSYKESFLAEAQSLSKARHSNVVQVYHIVENPGGQSIQFCMELCAGGSLQKSYESGPMQLSQVRKIATEVSLGLAALHHRGMLHRDIKPGNILLSSKGIAKLGDFGLVTDKLVFGYGSLVGYLDHLAYEVHWNKQTSAKSDIWALGMTLYRLLHGHEWYSRSPAPKHLVKGGNFVESLAWLPHVPKPWRRVIRKMMMDDPGSRYQTVEQVLSAISKLPTNDWTTTVATDAVNWSQETKGRRMSVEWIHHASGKHEWVARSEPLNLSGRSQVLGRSKEPLSKAKAIAELVLFFQKRDRVRKREA
ncbi:Serine/threonine-protein kinase PknD [Xanthomonas sacchari]|uniref:serine/threonine-protein kinase n=1 Tax=Xanthomonas sacchari TaxID=56458 RepID=UPI0022550ADA|nr:serine/threonine-protein kinase [Xanthomonas sacchari]MCW0395391.1 Serine/threonine-protein kinase PknD [Xanthomonas sacchari]MCW0444282.1 Serine/threonine-protein kinase PknD [Xanthomonas sacchari]